MGLIKYDGNGNAEPISEFELPKGCAVTNVGRFKNMPVRAVTDSIGPNVIVGGRDYRVHLVSLQLSSHEEAVELAQRVVNNGPGIYDGWFDYKDETQSADAFTYMMMCMSSRRKKEQ